MIHIKITKERDDNMEKMKICPKCGHRAAEKTAFCTKCGTKMVELAPPKQPEIPKEQEISIPAEAPKKKKKGVGIVIAIVVILLLAAAAFFAAPKVIELYQEITGQTDEEEEDDSTKKPGDDGEESEDEVSKANKYEHVYDNAALLDEDDCEYLDEVAGDLENEWDMEIAVVTADDLGGSTTKKYAQKMCNKYVENGFGFVVLIDMENRSVYIGQEGDLISEEAVDLILKEAVSYLKDGEYCDGIEWIMEEVVYYYENPEEAIAVSEEGIHRYELIVADKTWSQAYQDCLSRGGYLVRINSDEEYQAILNQIAQEKKDNIKFWLGAKRASLDSKEYRWVYEDGSFGEEVINGNAKYASYWLDKEPSFYDESVKMDETCLNMFYLERANGWIWNDVPEDILSAVSTYKGTIGYICEYED